MHNLNAAGCIHRFLSGEHLKRCGRKEIPLVRNAVCPICSELDPHEFREEYTRIKYGLPKKKD